MSELDDVLRDEADNSWVDMALARSVIADAELADLQLRVGLDDVLASILAGADAATHRPASAGRRRKVVVSLAVAGAVLVGGSTVGAAAGISYRSIGGALTGHFGEPGKTENDTSEYIDVNAPDFVAVAQKLAQDDLREGVRFAPGYDAQKNIDATIEEYVARNIADQPYGDTAQVTGVKGEFANAAACTWERSWLAAYEQHDAAAMTSALAGLDQTAHLKIMVKIDAANWLQDLIGKARQGDDDGLRTDAQMCTDVVQ